MDLQLSEATFRSLRQEINVAIFLNKETNEGWLGGLGWLLFITFYFFLLYHSYNKNTYYIFFQESYRIIPNQPTLFYITGVL